MRLQGYCIDCQRFRLVRVSPQDLALYSAGVQSVPRGVCSDCDESRMPTPRAKIEGLHSRRGKGGEKMTQTVDMPLGQTVEFDTDETYAERPIPRELALGIGQLFGVEHLAGLSGTLVFAKGDEAKCWYIDGEHGVVKEANAETVTR